MKKKLFQKNIKNTNSNKSTLNDLRVVVSIRNTTFFHNKTNKISLYFFNCFIIFSGVLSLCLIINSLIMTSIKIDYICILTAVSVMAITAAFMPEKRMKYLLPLLAILLTYVLVIFLNDGRKIYNLIRDIKNLLFFNITIENTNYTAVKSLLSIFVLTSSLLYNVFLRMKNGVIFSLLYSFFFIIPIYFALVFPNPFFLVVHIIFLMSFYFCSIFIRTNKNKLWTKYSKFEKRLVKDYIIKCSAYVMIFGFLIFFPINAIVMQNDFQMSEKFEEINQKLRTEIKKLFTNKISTSTIINYGELGDVDEIKYSDIPVFQISLLNNQPVYLREWSANQYKDGNWTDEQLFFVDYRKKPYISLAYDFEINSIPHNFLNIVKKDKNGEKLINEIFSSNKISVFPNNYDNDRVNKKDNMLVAVPSILNEKDFLMNQNENELEVYHKTNYKSKKLLDQYDANIITFNNLTKSKDKFKKLIDLYKKQENLYLNKKSITEDDVAIRDYISSQKQYNDYLNKKYSSDMPNISDQLKDFAQTLKGDDIIDTIVNIQKYFNQNIEYTLSPGATPDKKTFIEYFLFENKKGYCSHYATAMTVLLNENKIPARYAEGYYGEFKSQDSDFKSNVPFDVFDKNAHAWVEVYFQGLGWVPVEATSFYGNDTEIIETVEYNESKNQVENELSSTELSEASENQNISTEVNSKPEISIDEGIEISNNNENSNDNIVENHKFNFQIIIIIILLLGVLTFGIGLISWLLYRLYRTKRELKFETNNCRTDVLKLYNFVIFNLKTWNLVLENGEKTTDFCIRIEEKIQLDATLLEKAFSIYEKAMFSANNISKEERLTATAFAKQLNQQTIKKSKFIKKLLLWLSRI